MDKVLSFLQNSKDEYQSDLAYVSQEIDRLCSIIDKTTHELDELKSSIDDSYVIMSSSQMANNIENIEMETMSSLLDGYRNSLESYRNKDLDLRNKISTVNEAINDYLNPNKDDSFSDKISFIINLVKVDPLRAIEELKILQRRNY